MPHRVYCRSRCGVSQNHLHTIYRLEYPISEASTASAAFRPSRIAQTTRDCPLCISPAVNIPGILVSYSPGFVATLLLSFTDTRKASVTYFWLPRNPAAIRTSCASITSYVPLTGTIFMRPVFSSLLLSSLTVTAFCTSPFSSLRNSVTVV